MVEHTEQPETTLVPITSIEAPNPALDSKVTALYQAGERLLHFAEALVIQDIGDVANATRDLAVLASSLEAIEALRVQYVKPHNDHVKAVNDAFRTFVAPMKQADAIFRQKVRDHREEERRKIAEQEEINRLRQEAAARDMALSGELSEPVNPVPVQQEPPQHYRTGMGMLGGRKRWEYEVTDFAALPDDFKVVAPGTILAALRAGKTIPGVTARQVEDLTLRRAPVEQPQPPARPTPLMEGKGS